MAKVGMKLRHGFHDNLAWFPWQLGVNQLSLGDLTNKEEEKYVRTAQHRVMLGARHTEASQMGAIKTHLMHSLYIVTFVTMDAVYLLGTIYCKSNN